MRDFRDLFSKHRGDLCFIIGAGPSIIYAKNKLSTVPPNTFRIAINRAIEDIPAEYWFWIDGDAYEKSKDHPNAKAAIRIGVEQFQHLYDEDTYVWERVIGNMKDGLSKGQLVHRSTSLIAAISMAMRMGSCRVVMVGCDHDLTPSEAALKVAQKPETNWQSVYTFTFARINDALKNRDKWLPKEVMLRDASKIGTQWGLLPIPKTTIGEELTLNHDFHKWLDERKAGKNV